MKQEICDYHDALESGDKEICDALYTFIHEALPSAEHKFWHIHPVWFLDGNPVAGYSKLKNNVRLLFWSGQSFDEEVLINEGSFKVS
jgi:hypothetical protein